MDLSAITDFQSPCVEYISISLFCKLDFIDLLENSLPVSTHILFGLWFDLSKIFPKALAIVVPFLSFKGVAQHIYYKCQ